MKPLFPPPRIVDEPPFPWLPLLGIIALGIVVVVCAFIEN
jgi:hypothetical protein